MLEQLKHHKNPDMDAQIYGKTLFNNGVKIKIQNVDVVEEECTSHWKQVCREHGYEATIVYDLAAATVIINCTQKKVDWINITIAIVTAVGIARYLST